MGEGRLRDRDRIRYAATFEAAATEYERGRPTYPDAALDWLLPSGARTVCDLGAGTGKLTRSLCERGLEVHAVEPSAAMLGRLRSIVGSAVAEVGSAESTGLPENSMDAVLVAQAWHWVDAPRAVPEVARVLRPGGTLGLVWNLRLGSTEFARRLEELMGGSDQERWQHTDPSTVPGSPFGPGEEFSVDWVFELDADALVDMVASRSYVIAMDPATRSQLLDQVAALAQGDRAGLDTHRIEIPYRTRCVRFRLPQG